MDKNVVGKKSSPPGQGNWEGKRLRLMLIQIFLHFMIFPNPTESIVNVSQT